MSFSAHSSTKSNALPDAKVVGVQEEVPIHKTGHILHWRLKETAAFTVTVPNALIAAGFASMGLGFFTFFRPSPLLIYVLATHLKRDDYVIGKNSIVYTAIVWKVIILFVLFFLGFLLTFSVRIKRRNILLIHPWGLMILYFDWIIWLTLALCLHLQTKTTLTNEFSNIKSPTTIFIIIYSEIIIFAFLHYIYATYFISAELSVIERCY